MIRPVRFLKTLLRNALKNFIELCKENINVPYNTPYICSVLKEKKTEIYLLLNTTKFIPTQVFRLVPKDLV